MSSLDIVRLSRTADFTSRSLRVMVSARSAACAFGSFRSTTLIRKFLTNCWVIVDPPWRGPLALLLIAARSMARGSMPSSW
jgi:hypothetical protein